jgi:Domain of unknown function (DUF4375)
MDPRVPWERYAQTETLGQRMSALIDSILAVWTPREPWELLPERHRALFVIHFSMAEIYSGGLFQLYDSGAGDLADRLPAAAREFGADDYARIFERANGLFDAGSWASKEARASALDRFEVDGRGEELERLDDEILRLEEHGEPLWAYVLKQVEASRGDYFLDQPHG